MTQVTTLMPEGRQRFYNNDGTPCAGGLLYTYAAGTTNPKTTYADADGNVPNPNPVPLDAHGEAVIYWTGAYKVDLKQADGQQVTGYPVDNFRTDPAGLLGVLTSAGASLVGYLAAGLGAVKRSVWDRLNDVKSANDYGTIQQAINAAGATGCVVIPGSYAGTDAYSNPNNVAVLDLRNGGLGVHSWINNSFPVVGYPFGHDMVLRSMGSSDMYLEHYHVSTTTTQALVAGWNYAVPIAAVKCGNIRNPSFRTGGAELFSTIAQLVIGRDTANEEQVNQANWHYVDAGHIDILCAKSHAGTTDIEQGGSTLLASQDLYICPHFVKPSQATAFNSGLRMKDFHGNVVAHVPCDLGSIDPYASWRWGAAQMGASGANNDLVYHSAGTAAQVKWLSSAGGMAASLSDTGALYAADQITANKGVAANGETVLNGSNGALQLGKNSSAITSTTDAFVTWQNNTDPLNTTATGGSVLIASRNIANTAVHIVTQGTLRMRIGAAGVEAGSDNGISLGSASRRFSTVYAASGTINTSDQREKTQFAAISDALLDAWGEVREQIGVYQWLEAVAQKGAAARLHFGIPAQAIEEAFTRHGLDANRYGLFCEDPTYKTVVETRTERRQKTVLVEVPDFAFEQINGQMVRTATTRQVERLVTESLPVVDANGAPVCEEVSRAVLDAEGRPQWENEKPVTELVRVPVTMDVPVFEDVEIQTESQVPTGDTRKGVRFDECMWLEAAWVRRKLGT